MKGLLTSVISILSITFLYSQNSLPPLSHPANITIANVRLQNNRPTQQVLSLYGAQNVTKDKGVLSLTSTHASSHSISLPNLTLLKGTKAIRSGSFNYVNGIQLDSHHFVYINFSF